MTIPAIAPPLKLDELDELSGATATAVLPVAVLLPVEESRAVVPEILLVAVPDVMLTLTEDGLAGRGPPVLHGSVEP